MANPTLLTMPLCVNADKNTIPATDAGTSGLFSEEYGWQNINSLPLASGGKAPNRRDFNGVFALLGGIAYACQRGYTFEWDATQDYVVGCVVLDTNDNKRYECISDVTANATPPNADTTHWQLQQFGLDREVIPAFNTRDIITTSGTYTTPVTGWYKITAKGGGGGGCAGVYNSQNSYGGGGGGEGGTTIAYISMTAGDTATVVIGAGGTGGQTNGAVGAKGGDTTVTIGGNTYTAGGGGCAGTSYKSGAGGVGTINGCAGSVGGGASAPSYNGTSMGGAGGGAGGGVENTSSFQGGNGTVGGGGAGGGAVHATSFGQGGNGGDGFVWFEYFATI